MVRLYWMIIMADCYRRNPSSGEEIKILGIT
jgi:hypothetical protein